MLGSLSSVVYTLYGCYIHSTDYAQYGLCDSGVYLSHPSHYLIYPLTARVVGAQQMILQPISSIFPCSPLLSGTWRTPGLSIPWCCLSTSSSVCLAFFPRSPFKAWSKSVYSHTCYAYCQGFLSCLFLNFRSIHLHFFQNLSRFFPVLAVANTWFLCRPAESNRSPCRMQVPVLSARGI